MKSVGVLELVDRPTRITERASLPGSRNGCALDSVTSLLLHDLRNPLSAICGCAEMLLDGNLGPAASRRVVSNMHRAAGRMRELLADAATAARWRAEADQSGDLRSVLLASCETAGIAERPGIDVLLEAPSNIEVPVSPSRLKSVFVNLIVNAAEAMPGGGVIRITAFSIIEGLRIEVEDNGPGIPAEIRDRLFEPFVTARKEHGLGLGLALSRQTVRELGGDLHLEPSAGARFVISLPRRASAPATRRGERGA